MTPFVALVRCPNSRLRRRRPRRSHRAMPATRTFYSQSLLHDPFPFVRRNSDPANERVFLGRVPVSIGPRLSLNVNRPFEAPATAVRRYACRLRCCRAEVAELADAPDSKSGSLRGVWVRFPPSAPEPGAAGPGCPRARMACRYGRKFRVSGSGPAIGVSNSGPGPSGSIVIAPPLARNVAICCCAAKASGPDAPAMLLRNVCGFLTV